MGYELVLAAIKPIAKEVYGMIIKLAKANKKSIAISEANIEEALSQHLKKVNTFSSEISFRELNKPKSLSSIYIPLDLSLNLLNEKGEPKESESEKNESQSASKVIESVFTKTNNNVILKGVPGAGKSTTLKYICQKLLTDEFFLNKQIKFPILIRLREDDVLNNQSIPIFEYILTVFGIIIESTVKLPSPSEEKIQLDNFKKLTALRILNEHSPLLVLDGIDEVSNEIVKDKIIKNINELSLSATNARFILTTRKGDDLFHIENTQSFELAPLNDSQISDFAAKWLTSSKAYKFINQLKASSVYDSAKRPLTLSHLCAIFEKEGKIPEQSRSIYRKIVNLLILEWNLENQINRLSKFSGFEPDRKKEFLENLSYELSVHFNKNQFSTTDLEKCYRNLYMKYNLPLFQMSEVLNEIQVHNGLITQIGYDKFEFAHKSFQEYLAAEHLVKLPKLPSNHYLLVIPSEMALAVTLSSEPTEYLSYFIEECLLKEKCDLNYLQSFFTRITIEKPDFIESTLLGLSLLKLQDKYCHFILNSLKANSSKENETNKISFQTMNHTFNLLSSFENVVRSIISLFDYFGIRDIGKDNEKTEVTFYRKIDLTLENDTYLMTNDFYNHFMPNNVIL